MERCCRLFSSWLGEGALRLWFSIVSCMVILLTGASGAFGQYTPELEMYEGSAGCRVKLRGPYSGPNLEAAGEIRDPANNIVLNIYKQTYSSLLHGDYTAQVLIPGAYTCRVDYYADGFWLGELSRSLTLYPIPSGETHTGTHWVDTRAQFTAVLDPSTKQFNGRTVTESGSPGGSDTCHDPGSPAVPFIGPTGGSWSVGSSNQYGPDSIGWYPIAVAYYRSQPGRVPCNALWQQVMSINYPGQSDRAYRTNINLVIIEDVLLRTSRGGVEMVRSWP